MPDLINSIIETRKTGADIFVKSLTNINGLPELEIKNKIAAEAKNHTEIFPEGWYSPPPSGIVVLFSKKPFSRLSYKSLRDPESWPKKDFILDEETVGNVHISPVNKQTGMFGDIGFTFYRGSDEKIRLHLKNSYFAILEIAKYAQAGMQFSELCKFALGNYQNKFKPSQWLTVNSDPNHTLNIGHTVPGSFEQNFHLGNSFEQIKQDITTKRVYVNDNENFVIPPTCAFTIESRIEDYNNKNLPSVFFHFIVCINQGKKVILENFKEIFNTVGMDYIL